MPEMTRQTKADGTKYTYYVLRGEQEYARWHIVEALAGDHIRTRCGQVFMHILEFHINTRPGRVCAGCLAASNADAKAVG